MLEAAASLSFVPIDGPSGRVAALGASATQVGTSPGRRRATGDKRDFFLRVRSQSDKRDEGQSDAVTLQHNCHTAPFSARTERGIWTAGSNHEYQNKMSSTLRPSSVVWLLRTALSTTKEVHNGQPVLPKNAASFSGHRAARLCQNALNRQAFLPFALSRRVTEEFA